MGAEDRPDQAGTFQLNLAGGTQQGFAIGPNAQVNNHFHVAAPDRPTPREAPLLHDPVVGRDALLATLAGYLTHGPPPRRVVLCGMGGVGKSTLAAGFAGSDPATLIFPDGCFWIDCRADDAMDALARMGRAFGHSTDTYRDLAARTRAVRSLLAERRILVVTDDARSEEEVLPFLPAHREAGLLVTTRDEALASALTDRIVHVDRLDADAAIALLESLAGTTAAPGRDHDLPALVEELGGLPLALELIGKQARKEARRPGFSWTALRARYGDAAQRLGLSRGDRSVRAAFDQAWEESLGDTARRRFALLGLFPAPEILTGEVAVAWQEADDLVRDGLSELLDLSLIRQIDAVTLRLHPLLKDFAAEKCSAVPAEEQCDAHCRISDYHFERAPSAPVTWRDIQPVLASHEHACAAADQTRARRVFPWFGSVPVPGFLIDRGFLSAWIHHLGLDLTIARAEGPINEAYALFEHASALGEAGRSDEAVVGVRKALEVIESLPDPSAPVVPAATGKFAFRLGQLLAERGEVEEARHFYEVALAADRARGHDAAAIITLLQIGDLWLRSAEPDAEARGLAVFAEARELAREGEHPTEEVMALTRIAGRVKEKDPARALELVRAALRLDEPSAPRDFVHGGRVPAPAFASRQGARYAILLGRIAAVLLPGTPSALESAISAYAIAIRRSAEVDAIGHQAEALFWLGRLFEHLDRVPGHSVELAAAANCYAHAAHIVSTMEVPPRIDPRARLEAYIFPRMDGAAREALATRMEANQLEVVQEAIDRILARPIPSPPGA